MAKEHQRRSISDRIMEMERFGFIATRGKEIVVHFSGPVERVLNALVTAQRLLSSPLVQRKMKTTKAKQKNRQETGT